MDSSCVAAPVTNGGISDMLEEPAPGPAVLRVTAPTKPVQPKKAKALDLFISMSRRVQTFLFVKLDRSDSEAENTLLSTQTLRTRVVERRILLSEQHWGLCQTPWACTVTCITCDESFRPNENISLLHAFLIE
jgi:hypothetical protein